jgi:starvation-inducible DNA-binding protein
MTLIKSSLPEDVQQRVGQALQGTLIDLIDLSLVAKQVHWTLIGRNFRSIHLQLDDVVDTARKYTDIAAERAAAIGVVPHGLVDALREDSQVPQPSVDWIDGTEAISFFVGVFEEMIGRMRQRIEKAQDDQVSQELLIEITAALEKHWWMWQAENQPV